MFHDPAPIVPSLSTRRSPNQPCPTLARSLRIRASYYGSEGCMFESCRVQASGSGTYARSLIIRKQALSHFLATSGSPEICTTEDQTSQQESTRVVDGSPGRSLTDNRQNADLDFDAPHLNADRRIMLPDFGSPPLCVKRWESGAGGLRQYGQCSCACRSSLPPFRSRPELPLRKVRENPNFDAPV